MTGRGVSLVESFLACHCDPNPKTKHAHRAPKDTHSHGNLSNESQPASFTQPLRCISIRVWILVSTQDSDDTTELIAGRRYAPTIHQERWRYMNT
jgi:hypothetical protein